MDEEIIAIKRNQLVELPKGNQLIEVKWVYKKKMNAQSRIERYQARLEAKGYQQKAGIDYGEDKTSTQHEEWRRIKFKEGC